MTRAPLQVPDKVRRTATSFGAAGEAWLAALPDQLEGIARDWSLTLGEPYDRSWLHVGLALDRANFTVDDRDRTKGLYFVRYVDPKDISAAEQALKAVEQGAQIVRVHDVFESVQALKVWRGLRDQALTPRL